jgi:GNAT superfamily N-acetyltransferase
VNVRRPTAADAPDVAGVIKALDEHYLGESEMSVADVRNEWLGLDLERDAWIVELDGRVAGFAELTERSDELLADGYVHADFFGNGVGARLVELTESEAVARGAARLRNAVLGADERAHELLESRRYRPVRHFYRMRIELADPPPEPEWPDGFRVEPLDHPAEARAFHTALEEVFAEEWDHRPESFEAWSKRRLERGSFDPSLFFTVKHGDEIAAVAACDWKRMGSGFIGAIGVRKAWRRRGIALALLRHAFGEFHRRGERRVALGVDASNPTGATRLYERAGMHVAWNAVFFEKELERATV